MLGSVLQVLCAAAFLIQCLSKRLQPEPFWFPPTVGLVASAVAAFFCEYPVWQVHVLYFISLVAMVTLLPIVVLRVVRYRQFVAPGPSVAILATPAPVIALAFDE